MNAARTAIVTEARRWLGTPWKHHQSCKGIGCDCIGLISGVARELGFADALRFAADTRFRGYARKPDPTLLLTAVTEYLDPVGHPDAGDILLMRFDGEPRHFGLRTDPDYMIHAHAPAKRVVENRIDETWRSRVVGAFKYREVM